MRKRAEFEADGWELDDAVLRHEESPDRFHLPGEYERNTLQVGDRVKLLFGFEDADQPTENGPLIVVERMWVTIREIERDAGGAVQYVGELDSMPLMTNLLEPGAEVVFGPENVATILVPAE